MPISAKPTSSHSQVPGTSGVTVRAMLSRLAVAFSQSRTSMPRMTSALRIASLSIDRLSG